MAHGFTRGSATWVCYWSCMWLKTPTVSSPLSHTNSHSVPFASSLVPAGMTQYKFSLSICRDSVHHLPTQVQKSTGNNSNLRNPHLLNPTRAVFRSGGFSEACRDAAPLDGNEGKNQKDKTERAVFVTLNRPLCLRKASRPELSSDQV